MRVAHAVKDKAKDAEAAERTRLMMATIGLETTISSIAKRKALTCGATLDALESLYKIDNKMSPQTASHFKRAKADFGKFDARALTAEDIDDYISKRLAAKNGPKGEIIPGDRPATINRVLQLLGQSFKLAIERHHLRTAPKIRRLSERDNARQGFFSDAEFRAVHSHLPEDLQDFVLFGYLTGWRRGECASISWSNVEDGVIRLRAEDTKNGEARSIPIVGELVQVIERRKKARLVDGVLTSLLFHREGRAILEFRKSWSSACRLAGVNRLFHDLRRTAVRNFVRSGVSEKIAMTISGHKTRSIFDRYNITSETDQRDALQKVERYRQNSK